MVCFVRVFFVHRPCSKAAVLNLGFLKTFEIIMGFLMRHIKNIQSLTATKLFLYLFNDLLHILFLYCLFSWIIIFICLRMSRNFFST